MYAGGAVCIILKYALFNLLYTVLIMLILNIEFIT